MSGPRPDPLVLTCSALCQHDAKTAGHNGSAGAAGPYRAPGGPPMTVIHTPVPAEHHDLALRLLAAQDDDESRCGSCLMPVEPADLVDLDGGLCLDCLRARYGDDVYSPCHGRDL